MIGEYGDAPRPQLTKPQQWPLFYRFFGILLVAGVGGVAILLWVLPESPNRLVTIIQYLVAVGTLSLAAATFYNIQLSNQDLQLRRRDREKPLAVDELSNVVEPAIQAVSDNLTTLQDEEQNFDWAYVREPHV